jgi:hypothetical protein
MKPSLLCCTRVVEVPGCTSSSPTRPPPAHACPCCIPITQHYFSLGATLFRASQPTSFMTASLIYNTVPAHEVDLLPGPAHAAYLCGLCLKVGVHCSLHFAPHVLAPHAQVGGQHLHVNIVVGEVGCRAGQCQPLLPRQYKMVGDMAGKARPGRS